MSKKTSGKKCVKKAGIPHVSWNTAAIALVVLAFGAFLLLGDRGGYENPAAYNANAEVDEYLSVQYITGGEWRAVDFEHDLGRVSPDGNWESERNGFGYLISMNYQFIEKGSYNVTFYLKVENTTLPKNTPIVEIEMSKDRGFAPVSNRKLSLSDFAQYDQYLPFSITATLRAPANYAETRIHYDKCPVLVTVERVVIQRLPDDGA